MGEEITISYDRGSPSDSRRTHLKDAFGFDCNCSVCSRRTHLKDTFGFDCNCSVCSLPLPELQHSDARRLQIQYLDDAIGDPSRVMNRPDDCLADCHSLLQVLEEEYHSSAGASIARLYYDDFQICITHGDQARASVFAGRGHKSRVFCEGEDSPETRKVQDLMENPAGHMNFGVSTRWKTARGLILKGLDAGGFERWLWRKGR